MANVVKYTSLMDPMGKWFTQFFFDQLSIDYSPWSLKAKTFENYYVLGWSIYRG